MSGRYSDEQWKAITQADCVQVAKNLGLEFDEKQSDSKAIHVKGYGGLYVWRNGSGWYQHSSGESGHAVGLVQKIRGDSYRQALDFINDAVLGGEKPEYIPPANSHQKNYEKEKKEFVLPQKAENDKRVFAYLTKSRCIDPMIVRYALNRKLLFQEAKYGNCCFVGYDKDGNAKYCAKRGTNSQVQFRGEVTGSDKKTGWKLAAADEEEHPRLFVFESPIDALSHASLYLQSNLVWTRDTRLASGGCSPLALETELSLRQYKTIFVCTDNDEAGNAFAKEIASKYGADFHVVRKSPLAKDWNEDITNINRLVKMGLLNSTDKQNQIKEYYGIPKETLNYILNNENLYTADEPEIETG